MAGRGPAKLAPSGTAGEQITATVNGTRWPVLAEGLPRGPLQDRLKGLTSVRALLPAAKAASTVSEFRLCNTDDKTVAWLTVDLLHPAQPSAGDPPARLSLTAVRGYQAQADRIAQCLAAQPGMFRGAPPPLDAVLATVGHAPGEYTNKVDVELSPRCPPGWRSPPCCCGCSTPWRRTSRARSATSTPSSCTTCGSRYGGPGPR